MIQSESYLKVADNTGAKEIKCIRVLGGAKYLLINVDEGMELNGVSVRVPEEQKN